MTANKETLAMRQSRIIANLRLKVQVVGYSAFGLGFVMGFLFGQGRS